MTPPRGFALAEYDARLSRAQAAMTGHGLAALLLTTEPEVRYFSGFLTRFWESPTRPWFMVVPAAGKPVAVIPSIGAALMAQTWIDDIRTWQAPDLKDDGIGLLADTIHEIAGDGPVGLPDRHETHLRMPLKDLRRLARKVRLATDFGIMRNLRQVKSEAEIDKIRHACTIAARAFARVPEIAAPGIALSAVFRRFQMLCLDEGADWVPYLAGGAGPGGYTDVISPATDVPLVPGDVLMLDTGLVWDGYFCDYDRNFSVVSAVIESVSAHARLIEATQAAAEAARPGATAADLYHTMDRVLTGGQGGGDAGRLGHGLGMSLTEGLSLIPEDTTELVPGMVLTLEPGIELAPGRILVHEENIVIRASGAEALTPFAGPDMVVLGGG